MPLTPEQRLQALAQKISREVTRSAGKGLNAARIFFTARVKETLSAPAPRRAIRGPATGNKKGPILCYRARTPATIGAPPRKLSGRLRGSITSYMENDTTAIIGTNVLGQPCPPKTNKPAVGGFPYGKFHELDLPGQPRSGRHKYIMPTFWKYQNEINTIVGQYVTIQVQ